MSPHSRTYACEDCLFLGRELSLRGEEALEVIGCTGPRALPMPAAFVW